MILLYIKISTFFISRHVGGVFEGKANLVDIYEGIEENKSPFFMYPHPARFTPDARIHFQFCL